MTLHSRPERRQDRRNPAFLEQAAAVDNEQLHCLIPADLHRRLRVRAAGGKKHNKEAGHCRTGGLSRSRDVNRVLIYLYTSDPEVHLHICM